MLAIKVDNWNQELSPMESTGSIGKEAFGLPETEKRVATQFYSLSSNSNVS